MGSLSAMQASPAGSGWQRGESMRSIGRVFDRQSSSVFSVISPTGGIRPPDRRRGRSALSLSEREEISRGLSTKQSLRVIARQLGRAPSTISREVRRNGGRARYRATASDQAAWKRALRPKMCKLACHPRLACAVSAKLRRKWSPEQVAGRLKRAFPREAHKQVSHALTGRVLRSNVPRGERSTEAFIYRREASLKRNSWSICAQDGLLGVPNTPARSAREMARSRMLYLSSKGLHPSRIVPYRGTIAGRAYTVCPRGGKAT
jgi:hypothetical protein